MKGLAVLFFMPRSSRAVFPPPQPEPFLPPLSSFPAFFYSPLPFLAPFLLVNILFLPHLLALYGYYFLLWSGFLQNLAVKIFSFGPVPMSRGDGF